MSPGCGYWGGGKKKDGCILFMGITVFLFLELANVADSAWQIGVKSTN